MSASVSTADETNAEEEKPDLRILHDTKVSGGKSAWQMTLETVGMAEGGKGKKNDVIVDTVDEGLKAITGMVEEAAATDDPKWKFELSPLKQFNATLPDFFRAFVMWAKKDEETTINVSKAFRRLETYATWMQDHTKELKEPLTVDSIRAAAHAWKIYITKTKDTNQVVWWVDMAQIDMDAVKHTVTPTASIRFVVWMTHLIVLDPVAQEHGCYLMQALGNTGFLKTMTMVPMELGTQLDRLTIGVLPIRMKCIYMWNHLRWLSFLMGIMKPFMSKKMRQRMVLISKDENPQKVMDEVVGRDCIPVGFGGLEGTVEKDIIFGDYIKEGPSGDFSSSLPKQKEDDTEEEVET